MRHLKLGIIIRTLEENEKRLKNTMEQNEQRAREDLKRLSEKEDEMREFRLR